VVLTSQCSEISKGSLELSKSNLAFWMARYPDLDTLELLTEFSGMPRRVRQVIEAETLYLTNFGAFPGTQTIGLSMP